MYVEGFVLAVPTANREAFFAYARACNPLFREHGLLRQVECWADDLPDGGALSFARAVDATADDSVVFAWLEWPDRATRDAAMRRIVKDPRFEALGPLPFDGRRVMSGGFLPEVDL